MKTLLSALLASLLQQASAQDLATPEASEQQLYEVCDLAQDGQDCMNYPYETCKSVDDLEGVPSSYGAIC